MLEDNPEPRVPLILLLDNSGSMTGEPIAELNEGLRVLQEEIAADTIASMRVEVMILTFGGTVQARDVWNGTGQPILMDAQKCFVGASHFKPPVLRADGRTPMGEAMHKALELIRQRKDIYKQQDLDYFRPWIFLISDGVPTDDWQAAAEAAKREESNKGVLVFPIGVTNAKMEILAAFSIREPKKLKRLNFQALFKWISNSMASVSRGVPGAMEPLEPTDAWAEVSL